MNAKPIDDDVLRQIAQSEMPAPMLLPLDYAALAQVKLFMDLAGAHFKKESK